jgi:hypothetical protein
MYPLWYYSSIKEKEIKMEILLSVVLLYVVYWIVPVIILINIFAAIYLVSKGIYELVR